jgi:hypothetical protein
MGSPKHKLLVSDGDNYAGCVAIFHLVSDAHNEHHDYYCRTQTRQASQATVSLRCLSPLQDSMLGGQPLYPMPRVHESMYLQLFLPLRQA